MRLVLYTLCGCAAIGLGLCSRFARGKPAPQVTPKSAKSARNECHEQECVDRRTDADACKKRLAIEAVRLPITETMEYALHFAKHSTSAEQAIDQIRREEFKHYIPEKISQHVSLGGIQSSAILNTIKFGMSDMPWHPEDRELLAFVNMQDKKRECVQHVIVGRQSLAALPETVPRRSTKRRRSARGRPPTPPENFDGMGDASSGDDLLRKNARNIKNRFVYAVSQPVVEAAVAPPRECPDPRPTAQDIGPVQPVTPTSAPQPPRKKKSEESELPRAAFDDVRMAMPTTAAKKLTVELAIEQPSANTFAQLPANSDRIKQEPMFFDRRVAVVGAALGATAANAMVGDNDITRKKDPVGSPVLCATACPEERADRALSFSSSEDSFGIQGISGSIPCAGKHAIGKSLYTVVDLDTVAFNKKFEKFDADLSLDGHCFDKLSLPTDCGEGRYTFLRGERLVISYADGSQVGVCTMSAAEEMRGRVQLLANHITPGKLLETYAFEQAAVEILETIYEGKRSKVDPAKIGHELAGSAYMRTMEEDPKNRRGRR